MPMAGGSLDLPEACGSGTKILTLLGSVCNMILIPDLTLLDGRQHRRDQLEL